MPARRHAGERLRGASYFALLQHLPAALGLVLLGSMRAAGDFLVTLNLLSVAALVALGVLLLRRTSAALACVFVLVVAASPLPLYATRSFSEALAAFVLAAFSAALVAGAHPAVVCASAFVAGLSKETAPAFLLVLSVIALAARARSEPRAKIAYAATAAVLGMMASVVASALFNQLRFGTWSNAFYGQDALRVHELGTAASFAAAALASPSGGVLFFWPAFSLLLLVCAAVTVRAGVRDGIVTLVVVALAAFAAALCLWHSPFGWICWGDRLLMPWLPSLALLLLHARPDIVLAALSTLRAHPVVPWLVGGAVGLASLPQWLIVLDTSWMMDVFRPVPGCESIPDFWSDIPYYYRCLDRYLWPSSPTLVRMMRALAEPVTLALAVPYVVMFASGAALCARDPMVAARGVSRE